MGAATVELAQRIPNAEVKTAFDQTVAWVALANWVTAAAFARDQLGCVVFDWLGAEDAGQPGASDQQYAVLLHVLTPTSWDGLMLGTIVNLGEQLPSVATLWAGAQWHEREAAEMFGIDTQFNEPLLLPESFGAHPLRKDFVLASRAAQPWPGAAETATASNRGRTRPAGVPDEKWMRDA